MFLKVSLNLDIQAQYVDLLRDFQESQYKALQLGEYKDVFQLEAAIQKSLESLRVKRQELREELTGDTVREFAARFPQCIGNMLRQKLDNLIAAEYDILVRAARNADLAMRLAGLQSAALERWTVFPADLMAAEGAAKEMVQ